MATEPKPRSPQTPVIDPTENVIALTEAANRRQDDLRAASERFQAAQIAHLNATMQLRGDHAKEIRRLETERVNAIRQVDVTAVKTEADRALAAIQTLAATTATNADNLRTALTNTATTIAKQTADTVGEITTRIAALEKSSYEGLGKSRVADPQMAEFMADMRKLILSQGAGQAKSEAKSDLGKWIFAAVAALGTVVAIAGAFAAVVIFIVTK